MSFNSLQFAVFLPIVFAAYWICPPRYRWGVLLAASYIFYAFCSADYLLLLALVSMAAYAAALLIERSRSVRCRKACLICFTAAVLSILVFFKYFNFMSTSIAALFSLGSVKQDPFLIDLLLPVGISFYTFVSVSYVADVYKGKIAAEKHLGRFALFISFFPTVLSGPIERANNLLAQINRPSPFDYDLAVYGLRDLLIGFFKKMVVADSLGVFVDSVYGSVHSYSGFTLVIIALFYTVQIYCDFSGYSSIAVGIAKLFGIRLRKNFGYPYFATSIKAFWGEWHISLSTWFRDYVYIPLGGNRVGKLRHKLNLMITFLVSGLWHGASWNFVIWGGIHGFVQVVESGFSRKDKSGSRILGFVKWLFVMLIVTVAWVFFRAQTLGDAAYVFAHCFEGIGDIKSYVAGGVGALPVGMLDVALAVVPAVLLFALELLCKGKPFAEAVDSVNKPMRWVIYVLLVLMIVFLTPVINASTFLYFQF